MSAAINLQRKGINKCRVQNAECRIDYIVKKESLSALFFYCIVTLGISLPSYTEAV